MQTYNSPLTEEQLANVRKAKALLVGFQQGGWPLGIPKHTTLGGLLRDLYRIRNLMLHGDQRETEASQEVGTLIASDPCRERRLSIFSRRRCNNRVRLARRVDVAFAQKVSTLGVGRRITLGDRRTSDRRAFSVERRWRNKQNWPASLPVGAPLAPQAIQTLRVSVDRRQMKSPRRHDGFRSRTIVSVPRMDRRHLGVEERRQGECRRQTEREPESETKYRRPLLNRRVITLLRRQNCGRRIRMMDRRGLSSHNVPVPRVINERRVTERRVSIRRCSQVLHQRRSAD